MSSPSDTDADRIDSIATAAHQAAATWAAWPRPRRARTLRAVADRLETRAADLVPIAMRESHLTEPRLRGELARTTFQLRLFADVVDEGGYLDVRIDHADTHWPMGVRPDLRRTRVPYGAVVVFAASNFPFAFSVAGGDTASALAAGCSVILKAHPGHPDLSAATAETVCAALADDGCPDGLFQIVYGDDAGRAALSHPLVKAGAFTGSIAGGRALFDLAAARPEPIPFYAEMGSVNPVFVTATADARRGADLAAQLIDSFTLGVGQFCTKPGLVFAPESSNLLAELSHADLPAPAPMLNERIADGYQLGLRALRDHDRVRVVETGTDPGAPAVLVTDIAALRDDPEALLAECFGPVVLVVEYAAESQLLQVADALPGQLTATLVADEGDSIVPELARILGGKAGRLLWNQWPTGVSVTHAQQHGGPFPATTAPGTTSVGTAAIDRFTRPLTYQGFPAALLPSELHDDPDVPARVDGRLVVGPPSGQDGAAQR
jgi:NADP-dependent aldehyde dehydrogenase